jgi:putative transposase
VQRNFTAEAHRRKPIGDITYIHTWDGFLYLATVIGWSIAGHMRTTLIADALDMAAGNIGLEKNCRLHSDRGSQ